MRLIIKRVVSKKTKKNNLFNRCFEGKVAMISGAGQGIGKQIVLDLYSEGAKIAAFDINEEQVCAKKAWQFLPVRVRIRQRLATSLTPIPHTGG